MPIANRPPRIRGRSVGIALVLAALAVLAARVFDGDADSHAHIEQVESIDTAGDDSDAPIAVDPDSVATADAPRAALGSPLEAPAATAFGSEDPLALRGRVVDATGSPVPAARVELLRRVLSTFTVLDPEVNHAREAIAATTTDLRGEFHFALERGLLVDVRATDPAEDGGDGDHTGASAIEPNRRAGQYVVLELTRGSRIEGRVLRASDRAPVGGGTVRAIHRGSTGITWTTTVAANGSFHLRVSREDNVVIEVVPLEERISDWVPVTFDDGLAEVEVVVQEGFVATGRVVSSADGLPIAGATVGEGWTYRRRATTDAEGVYRMPGFGRPGSRDLFAKAPGFGEAKCASPPEPVDGVVHVDFELQPARMAFGRVVDATGSPLADVDVAAIASQDDEEGQRTDWISTRTDADGRFEVKRLTPHLRHALLLARHGYTTRTYDFPEREFEVDRLDLGTFALGPPALLAGVVRTSAGAPVANATVVLKGHNSDRGRLLERRFRSHEPIGDFYSNTRSMRSDAKGRFAFGDVAAGSYELYARSSDGVKSLSSRRLVAEATVEEDIVLELPVAAKLAGRVVAADGRPIANAFIDPSLVEADAPEDLVPSPAFFAFAHTADDGTFEVRGLSPGTYRVTVRAASHADAEAFLDASVERVHTSDEPIEVVLETAAVVTGVVAGLETDGATRYVVSVSAPDGTHNLGTVESDGSFRLVVPHDAVVDVRVHAGRSSADPVLATELGVVAGTSDLVLTVP